MVGLPNLMKRLKSQEEIEFYEGKCKIYEEQLHYYSPTFIEIDENGDVLNLRDKIRINGITIKI